jgi:tryptophan-rich sensory protein
MRTMNNTLRLIISIAICQMAGVIGSIATVSSVRTFYTTLAKPSFNPPGWIFGPVWITLYAVMGIAAWIVWKKLGTDPGAKTALIFFIIQLVLNALWSHLFFGWHLLFIAFLEIVLLWIMILLSTIWFFRVSTTAGALMVPYLAWVSFASVLNYSIWALNR